MKSPQLPGNGTFTFYEYEGNPSQDWALYSYKDNNGNSASHLFPSEDVSYMYDQLSVAKENLLKGLEIAGALANLSAAGAPAKSELKGLSAELKVEQKITLKETWAPREGGFLNYTLIDGKINISGRSVTNGTFYFVITQEGKLEIGSKHYV